MRNRPETCPHCGDPRLGPFCEQCGHAYSTACSTVRRPGWCAVIAPDRDYFATAGQAAAQFTFPASSRPRRITLSGSRVRIGRHSRSRGITPEIDLGVAPADPCVSREHALLLAQPDGSWAVRDDGSENGTYLNGEPTRIPTGQPTPLAEGDRVHLGLWTTITLHRDQ